MSKQGINNGKLGGFMLAGLLALILSFYFIGKNQHLFGAKFKLRARFSNLNSLIEGSNVLYAGIQAGTVSDITLINDTTIEVTLLIDKTIRQHIHQRSVASIGTEGLMGNKIVNIVPSSGNYPLVGDGDLLSSRPAINTDEMLQTLSRTNQNIAGISEALKVSVLRINESKLLALLDDPSIGNSLKSALKNMDRTAAQADQLAVNLNRTVTEINKGKGLAGTLVSDTLLAGDLRAALGNIRQTTEHTQSLTRELDDLLRQVNSDLVNGKGTLHLLLKDSVTAGHIRKSLEHIEQGTDGFNQNMEALKHNFLFRGYFKDQAKKSAKQTSKP
ncbi:MCE family protein [Mucilaginibacter sp. 14171R-50]|uniref:MlaD family protein n=1 Tax=Mucilaginibacter sp. 14171R-50 TaxID=2703789 RepID=UPI00138C496E|nr:MlaD family protein [Mucilaginibacter sp. 14171R-50]QHS55300.1 MCE family protein [Mucilaginibacter sp. 14171R-50]